MDSVRNSESGHLGHKWPRLQELGQGVGNIQIVKASLDLAEVSN